MINRTGYYCSFREQRKKSKHGNKKGVFPVATHIFFCEIASTPSISAMLLSKLPGAFVFFVLLFVSVSSAGQSYSVSFDTSHDVTRSKTADVQLKLFLKTKLGTFKDSTLYKVVVAADPGKSNIDVNSYKLEMNERVFNMLSDTDSSLNIVNLIIKKDSQPDRTRLLVLTLKVLRDGKDSSMKNAGTVKEININIKGIEEEKSESSYSVGFEEPQVITRSKEDLIYPIYLKAALGKLKDISDYKAVITVDRENSTLPPTEFSIDNIEKNFSSLSEKDPKKNILYLLIKKDSLEDRQRKIILSVAIKKKDKEQDTSENLAAKKRIEVLVNGIRSSDSLKAYNYLAYIGTNFDLVDGPKAKNLFFASNIFIPPAKKKSVGLYLSLYGNRTMTSTDSTGNVTRTTRLVNLTDSTYRRFTEQATMIRTEVSDNLGAYISPLIKLWQASSRENKIQLYYTPSLEFVWRRTTLGYSFKNSTNFDSTTERGRMAGRIDYSNSATTNSNEFVFNVGVLGFMVVHESKEISVRVHCSTGYCSSYFPPTKGVTRGSLDGVSTTVYERKGDIFFSGRAWITESVTGLTLQAEITNTLKNSRPFYGVTLSKAINFQNLSKIFQPIVARN